MLDRICIRSPRHYLAVQIPPVLHAIAAVHRQAFLANDPTNCMHSERHLIGQTLCAALFL